MRNKSVCALLFATLALIGQPGSSGHPRLGTTRLAPGNHVARLGTLTLHYAIAGKGPLLIVQAPGWGIGTEYLEKGLAPLTEHFTVLTYDPRGTGLSTPVSKGDRLTNADLAEDLERLRAYLGLKTLDLIGHSNGGAIAILYAEEHPARVKRLVLIGSQLLGYGEPAGPVEKSEDARRRTHPEFAAYAARMRASSPRNDAEFTRDFKSYAGVFFYDPHRDLPALLKAMTKPMSASMNKAYKESPPPSEAPPLDDLAKISAPTLIVEGRQDPACALAESERIKRGIANSRLVSIDRSGHFPWIEQPSQFFAPVIRFLASPRIENTTQAPRTGPTRRR
ncbi:alpha/beta fold hydrolase [Sphingomonas morindae]|uniref:Alpha/beta hydrolase n=1 Tax=Sphingomonas morindae TaxID=1541170 RepID=A0ABY4X9L6_9SPHN|nr:alpha/beta hydrolase [Sphingomonas morindae]USI73504.1 alpha/beta hydrolase [Sphingomonas morindae]